MSGRGLLGLLALSVTTVAAAIGLTASPASAHRGGHPVGVNGTIERTAEVQKMSFFGPYSVTETIEEGKFAYTTNDISWPFGYDTPCHEGYPGSSSIVWETVDPDGPGGIPGMSSPVMHSISPTQQKERVIVEFFDMTRGNSVWARVTVKGDVNCDGSWDVTVVRDTGAIAPGTSTALEFVVDGGGGFYPVTVKATISQFTGTIAA